MARHILSEFRQNWCPFTACFLGMGSALALNSFIVSTFAPYLIAEFGWSRAEWAMTGTVILVVFFCIPVAGRLADIFGVRRVAGVGIVVFPLSCVAITMMNGDIRVYLAIYVAQAVLCCTTTATIYTRLVAEKFVARRGLALALCAGSPALAGAVGSPLLSALVESHGWRAGYLAVAAYSAICGAVTLALIPPFKARADAVVIIAAGRSAGAYRAILQLPLFWVMLVATFLVSLPHALVATQLKMVVLEQGVSDAMAALMISVFAGGVMAGRLMSGLALDFLPPHTVAAVSLGLPCAGMLILASNLDAVPYVGMGILLVGLAFGGEGDVIAYLIVRFFGIEIYSTVLGLLTAAMATASAVGAGLLGFALKATDSFNLYLIVAAIGVFIGSIMFQLLGSRRFRRLATG